MAEIYNAHSEASGVCVEDMIGGGSEPTEERRRSVSGYFFQNHTIHKYQPKTHQLISGNGER